MINFIQIGASTGDTPQKEDIIWPIVRERGWSGIFIEPLPSQFSKLVWNYRDLLKKCFFENVAVMPYDGVTDIFYEASGDHRIASTNSLHAGGRNNVCIQVPCLTIESIIEKYKMVSVEFELLQIDTEGLDADILISTDFTFIKPKQIRFEHCHLGKNGNKPKSAVVSHLESFGYKEVEDTYKNALEGEQNIDTLMELQQT